MQQLTQSYPEALPMKHNPKPAWVTFMDKWGVGIVFISSKRSTRRRDGAGRLNLAVLLDGPRRFGPGWKTTFYGAPVLHEGPLCDVVQFNAIDARV